MGWGQGAARGRFLEEIRCQLSKNRPALRGQAHVGTGCGARGKRVKGPSAETPKGCSKRWTPLRTGQVPRGHGEPKPGMSSVPPREQRCAPRAGPGSSPRPRSPRCPPAHLASPAPPAPSAPSAPLSRSPRRCASTSLP